jgi:hypothetical protein
MRGRYYQCLLDSRNSYSAIRTPRYARRAHISSRGDHPYGCAWCLPAGRSVVPVRELGAHRLAVAISGTRPVAEAPAGRSPMALPEAGSGQLPRVQLNGFAAARPGCARLRHGANHARPADELARAARPRRYGGAADAQHKLSKRAPHQPADTRPALCLPVSARFRSGAPGRHRHGQPSRTPRARADRLQMRQEAGPDPPHRGRRNAIGAKWSPR